MSKPWSDLVIRGEVAGAGLEAREAALFWVAQGPHFGKAQGDPGGLGGTLPARGEDPGEPAAQCTGKLGIGGCSSCAAKTERISELR